MSYYNYKNCCRKLSRHEGCQCGVDVYESGIIEFISYSTLVIVATPISKFKGEVNEILEPVTLTEEERSNAYVLQCTGTYSPTTRKQIGYFLKEYFGDVTYQHMKEIAGEDNMAIVAVKKTAKYW